MDLKLAGKTALVTGGSRGLGRYSAIALASEGCNVSICGRGVEDLKKTETDLKALGVKVATIECDVTTETGTSKAYEQTKQLLGSVDILINNVGGHIGRDFDSADDKSWDHTFQLNLFSAIRLIRLCLPEMKTRSWGRILNISSIYGREYGGGMTYMTSKASLIAFSKHLAIQLAQTGVTVNTIAPGSIAFDGGSWQRFQDEKSATEVDAFINNNLPMGKFGWPEPIGSLVAFLASEHAGLITGTAINVDGGQSKSLI